MASSSRERGHVSFRDCQILTASVDRYSSLACLRSPSSETHDCLRAAPTRFGKWLLSRPPPLLYGLSTYNSVCLFLALYHATLPGRLLPKCLHSGNVSLVISLAYGCLLANIHKIEKGLVHLSSKPYLQVCRMCTDYGTYSSCNAILIKFGGRAPLRIEQKYFANQESYRHNSQRLTSLLKACPCLHGGPRRGLGASSDRLGSNTAARTSHQLSTPWDGHLGWVLWTFTELWVFCSKRRSHLKGAYSVPCWRRQNQDGRCKLLELPLMPERSILWTNSKTVYW